MLVLITLLLGAGLATLLFWLRSRSISLKWYEWVLGVIGLVLVIFAIQHYFGSISEMAYKAGTMGLAVFGIPGIILLVLAWQLVARSDRSTA